MVQFFESSQGIMVVGAVVGAAGILIGMGVSSLPQWLKRTGSARLNDNREARHLAMRTVIALDDFVGACYVAANDSPEFNPSDPGDFVLHTDDPALVLPRDVDWTILRSEIADDILWMPNRVRNVLDALESLEIAPPDFDHFFEHRREDFSRLGLRALDLIEKLCAAYGLTPPERPNYYDPRARLQGNVDQMTALWDRQRRAKGNQPTEPSNITPLFSAHRRDRTKTSPDTDPRV